MEERKKILELIAAGHLTVDEGERILRALDGGPERDPGVRREVRREVKIVRPRMRFAFGFPGQIDDPFGDDDTCRRKVRVRVMRAE